MTLSQANPLEEQFSQRQKVSEYLHEFLLNDLRRLLGDVLQNRDKVFVLIDNLDKTWEKRHDLNTLANFLFGLLNVGQVVPQEFHRTNSRKTRVNLALIVFLRSDIYSEILSYAREKDRLKASFIDWNDPLLAETEVQFPYMEDLMTAFAGSPEIVTRHMIAEYMEEAVIPKAKIKDIIQFLCDVTFLGLETSFDNFEFIYDERRKKVIQSMARKVVRATGTERYKINIPFHAFLGIHKIN